MENSLFNSQNSSSLPIRHSSMNSLGKGSYQDHSNQHLKQFNSQQMEILKLQKALQGYQARGQIATLDLKRGSAGQLSRNNNVKLPQIERKHVYSQKDIHLKLSQPVKIAGQIKYNLSKEMQELWSNNLNGNYYYLQDKNNQWESRKQKWLGGLDNCLQSEYIDYQEMYDKYFKDKYVKKQYQIKKKPRKILNKQDNKINHVNQEVEAPPQVEQEISQNEIKSHNTSTLNEESNENQGRSDRGEMATSDRNNINLQQQQSDHNQQLPSQNTSMAITTNRPENVEMGSESQNEQSQIEKEVEGEEKIQLGGGGSSQEHTFNVLESQTEMQNLTQSIETYQIKPINTIEQIPNTLHKKNKTLPPRENQMKLSVISPSMKLNSNYNTFVQNNNSFHSINQANPNSSVFSSSKHNYESQYLLSPQNSNRTSKQEFYPLNRLSNQIYTFQNQQLQKTEKNLSEGQQNKFSLAQLKTKNFSKGIATFHSIYNSILKLFSNKVTQSSQKSEDYIFRVSQVVNLKKYY